MLPSLPEELVRLDDQLGAAQPRVLLQQLAEIGAGVRLGDLDGEILLQQALERRAQQPLGIVLPDLLASHAE